MAIVVMHLESETNYVLLGAGFGSWATDKPGILGFSDRKEGFESTVFVCDASGAIGRFDADELMVVTVDGQPVSEHLGLPPSSLGQ